MSTGRHSRHGTVAGKVEIMYASGMTPITWAVVATRSDTAVCACPCVSLPRAIDPHGVMNCHVSLAAPASACQELWTMMQSSGCHVRLVVVPCVSLPRVVDHLGVMNCHVRLTPLVPFNRSHRLIRETYSDGLVYS
jgi:hypothetical protein